VVQKYINLWYSASLDLFGSEDSSNAAAYFAQGLKGRFKESTSKDIADHVALEGSYPVEVPQAGGALARQDIPLRRAMNLILRDRYIEDCERALARWNKVLQNRGLSERLHLPSQRFNREIGLFAGLPFAPDGRLVAARRDDFLPTEKDRAYVQSLMVPVHEQGKFASWIAPPTKGINGQPLDFPYVDFGAR